MWKVYDISNGCKTCDNLDLKAEDIPDVLKILEKEFDLDYSKGAVSGGFAGLDFCIENKQITVGWDNWSGVFIMSQDSDGNNIIDKIETLLNSCSEE